MDNILSLMATITIGLLKHSCQDVTYTSPLLAWEITLVYSHMFLPIVCIYMHLYILNDFRVCVTVDPWN